MNEIRHGKDQWMMIDISKGIFLSDFIMESMINQSHMYGIVQELAI